MPGPYLFTGLSTLGYPDYADLDTGRMLVAEPAESYGIRAINGDPVPPADGRWTAAGEDPGEESGPPPGIMPPPPVPPVPPVPPLEGSEPA